MSIVKTGSMSSAEHKIRPFIRDIEPFFYKKPVIYVDVGAYSGAVFREVFQSGLKPIRSYLIEPNPASYGRLKETVAALEAERVATCYNLALGAEAGTLRLRAQDTMTRVLAENGATEAAETDFDIPARSLDALAVEFVSPHVSLLKIDVEGFEAEVLAGAAGLLAAQAVDMIYIEAGLDPETRQQTYYRAIEDGLRAHGYRLFRIYEQHHEWATDLPVLRRVNLAFISGKFAEGNPLRLSKDLHALRRDHDELQRTLAERDRALGERDRAIEAARAEAAAAAAALREAEARAAARDRAAEAAAEREAALGARAEALEAERARRAEALEAARADQRRAVEEAGRRGAEAARQLAALKRELDALTAYGCSLEARHLAMLESETWRLMEPARRLIRLIRRRSPAPAFVPRLGGTAPRSAARAPSRGARALELEAKLWGGFSAQALADLEALKADPATDRATLAETGWVLARWQAAERDYAAAAENVALMHRADPGKRLVGRCVLLESDCLMRLGQYEEARARLEEALARAPGDPHLRLAMANALLPAAGAGKAAVARSEAARLDWINRIYADAGLAPLAKRDGARPLGIDNLAGPAAADAVEGPMISVILPAFRAAGTLETALRGLLAQSWAALEILVVDDCSPDDTFRVAEAIAARDPRVKALRQTTNQGGYAARNAGLRAATGALITTHDADDWSHPQKLETQARWLAENPAAVACFSNWVRCGSDLRVGWLNRAWGGFIAKNMSSIMLRREAFDALGGWDVVRVGADTDLLRRAERRFGAAAIGRTTPNAPLAFALLDEGSLTQATATHVRTMLHGPRREYEEAGAFWRAKAAPEALRLSPDPDSDHPGRRARPFPAPPSLLGTAHPELDLLFVSDFCLRGGAFVSTHNYVEAARAAGRRVGLFHWRRYDLDSAQPLNPAVRALAQSGEISIVAPGEAVRAETVVIGYPAILAHPIDRFPAVDSDHLVVVVNQMASRLHGGEDPQYDPAAARATLATLLGREGAWAPISGLVARLMRADPRYPAPSETIWTPLLDTATWCAAPLRWRGGAEAVPVIGRHARDHYTKWPAEAAALRAAYCADRPCQVEIMGGAARALEALGGKKPDNWTVHRFGAMEALPFLQRLDFFVHYPLETYIEEFGRAVLEALAAGLPAILPPVFRESFGEAAVYAEPDAVWDRIEALWGDEAGYLAQAARGRDFVLANSDWSCFAARLARTVAQGTAPAAAAPGLLPA